MSRTNFDEYLDEQLKDPDFTAGFERAGMEWDLALQIARRRTQKGLTQAALAKRVGTTQQQISRLERPGYRGSLSTIERVAAALGAQVQVRLTAAPAKQSGKSAKNSGKVTVAARRRKAVKQ